MVALQPVLIPPNVPPTFYAGGPHIAELRRRAGYEVPPGPEDWIASVVPRHGSQHDGLTILQDGRSLQGAIAADPPGWLGPSARFWEQHAAPPLVKLLDAGQRLPIHIHPDDRFARSRLGHPCGKAEAWFILSAQSGAQVHVGWNAEVSEAQLGEWVARQDVEAMLAAMNTLPAVAGDAVYVPPGVPHTIGEGVFLVEVQQPADLSILLEWHGFAPSQEAGWLGLPWREASAALERSSFSAQEFLEFHRRGALWGNRQLLPAAADAFFTAEAARGGDDLHASYRTVVCCAGSGTMTGDFGQLELTAGMSLAVPYASGDVSLSGDVEVLGFAPPA